MFHCFFIHFANDVARRFFPSLYTGRDGIFAPSTVKFKWLNILILCRRFFIPNFSPIESNKMRFLFKWILMSLVDIIQSYYWEVNRFEAFIK